MNSNLNIEKQEQILKHLFQHKIKIMLGDDVLDFGVFHIYKTKNYCFQIDLRGGSSVKRRIFELPIPFRMEVVQNVIIFDYGIDLIEEDLDDKTYNKFQSLKCVERPNFFDKKISIIHE